MKNKAATAFPTANTKPNRRFHAALPSLKADVNRHPSIVAVILEREQDYLRRLGIRSEIQPSEKPSTNAKRISSGCNPTI